MGVIELMKNNILSVNKKSYKFLRYLVLIMKYCIFIFQYNLLDGKPKWKIQVIF